MQRNTIDPLEAARRLLNVNEQSSIADIKRQYRRLAIQYHPDKNPDDANATERFQELSNAYTLLTSPPPETFSNASSPTFFFQRDTFEILEYRHENSEWLVRNNIGGFISSSITHPSSNRRFHFYKKGDKDDQAPFKMQLPFDEPPLIELYVRLFSAIRQKSSTEATKQHWFTCRTIHFGDDYQENKRILKIISEVYKLPPGISRLLKTRLTPEEILDRKIAALWSDLNFDGNPSSFSRRRS